MKDPRPSVPRGGIRIAREIVQHGQPARGLFSLQVVARPRGARAQDIDRHADALGVLDGVREHGAGAVPIARVIVHFRFQDPDPDRLPQRPALPCPHAQVVHDIRPRRFPASRSRPFAEDLRLQFRHRILGRDHGAPKTQHAERLGEPPLRKEVDRGSSGGPGPHVRVEIVLQHEPQAPAEGHHGGEGEPVAFVPLDSRQVRGAHDTTRHIGEAQVRGLPGFSKPGALDPNRIVHERASRDTDRVSGLSSTLRKSCLGALRRP